MNLWDYDIIEEEKDNTRKMEYGTFNYDGKYPEGSVVSMKGRPDAVGRIDRIEEADLVVKIFGETYKIPPEKFESLFFVHSDNSPENWYSKLRYRNNQNI
jgi:hypothetical protein